MAVDTSFSTFLRVTGKRNYIRTGLFKRKRAKTYDNADGRERAEYNSWKRKREEEDRKSREIKIPTFQGPGDAIQELLQSVEYKQYEAEEIDYAKLFEEEQAAYFNGIEFLKNLKVTEKYPDLIPNVYSSLKNYNLNFNDSEKYAGVKSEASPDGEYNESWIERHVTWMITPDGTEPNLRQINSMGRWTFQGDVATLAKGGGGGETTPAITNPTTETSYPRPPKLGIGPLQSDTTPKGIGGENQQGNPRLGSYTPRGGILGGYNYASPYDAIENEYQYRDKTTKQER